MIAGDYACINYIEFPIEIQLTKKYTSLQCIETQNRLNTHALSQAWAMYKGKFQEGRDKADPSTWKTRLRCALNKSTDFQEVSERSQLDISEPYKVYRILEDTGRATGVVTDLDLCASNLTSSLIYMYSGYGKYSDPLKFFTLCYIAAIC